MNTLTHKKHSHPSRSHPYEHNHIHINTLTSILTQSDPYQHIHTHIHANTHIHMHTNDHIHINTLASLARDHPAQKFRFLCTTPTIWPMKRPIRLLSNQAAVVPGSHLVDNAGKVPCRLSAHFFF